MAGWLWVCTDRFIVGVGEEVGIGILGVVVIVVFGEGVGIGILGVVVVVVPFLSSRTNGDFFEIPGW